MLLGGKRITFAFQNHVFCGVKRFVLGRCWWCFDCKSLIISFLWNFVVSHPFAPSVIKTQFWGGWKQCFYWSFSTMITKGGWMAESVWRFLEEDEHCLKLFFCKGGVVGCICCFNDVCQFSVCTAWCFPRSFYFLNFYSSFSPLFSMPFWGKTCNCLQINKLSENDNIFVSYFSKVFHFVL